MTLREPLLIGPLSVWPPVVLAPMAGITNYPFRSLCRQFGAGLYVSEMIGARALVDGHGKTRELASFGPGETPRSIQLYGTDADSVGRAVAWLIEEEWVDHIDLNFGCPAPKVTRHGGGAALPWKTDLFASIVTAAVRSAGHVPVTVKLRKGIDDDHLTYLDAGRIAEDAGAAAVALHARTAEELYSGKADWAAIAALAGAVTSIPVLGNGDIWEAQDAVAMMDETGCDGVVVGRGCLGRPWLFRDLADVFDGRAPQTPPNLGEVADIMRDHAERLVRWFGLHLGIRGFRKHPGWYLKGFPAGPVLRNELSKVESLEQLDVLLDQLDRSLPFPPAASRMGRGHTHGPKRVKLPHGYLESRTAVGPLPAEAAVAVSGG